MTAGSETHDKAGVPPPSSSPLAQLGWILGRSLFPFAALTIILGTMLWGPWATLVLTAVWWHVVTRIG